MDDYVFNLTVITPQGASLLLDPYIAKNGLSFETVQRVSRTITMMNGTEIRKSIDKIRFSVSLFEIDEATKRNIEYYLKSSSPVSVSYELNGAAPRTAQFYLDGWSPKVKIVEAGIPYYEGLSFTLEEK